MSSIDLHMHSSYSSDGEYTPEELIELCKQAGLETISLTDHNSVKGIKEARQFAKESNLKIIPGIEIDCTHEGYNLHILGYNIDDSDNRFFKLEESIITEEQQASKIRLEKIKQIGIEYDDEELKKMAFHGIITGEMIAESALRIDTLKPSDKRNPLLNSFYTSKNPYVDFYWAYCSQGKPAYAPVSFISLSEAVELICTTGGTPVFAHPAKNIGCNKLLLDSIIVEGVQGIEVYSNYHSEDETNFYLTYAENNQLFYTCGSDFHGKTKPSIQLGKFGKTIDQAQIINQAGIQKIIRS
ncbi:MAG: PHP domain-containing protein [Dysgonomonas sp.]